MEIIKRDMKKYKKVWVTSDLHGYYNLFSELLEKIGFSKEDLLIIAGDSCDRGRYSFDIYNRVQELIEKGYNIIHTFGNHEDLMVKAVEGGEIHRWYRNGGRTTIDSYDNNWNKLEKDLNFIKSMPVAVDLGRYFVVHAGIDPKLSIEEQDTYNMTWIRGEFIENELLRTEKIVIYGHTPNLDGKIHFLGKQKISIDCGSYDTGVVGAIELKSMDIIYVKTDVLNPYLNPYF